MILLGAITLFCVYQFYFRDKQEQVSKLESEIKADKAEIAKLDQLWAKRQDMGQNLQTYAEELTRMVKRYPVEYRFDDLVVYLNNLEKDEQFGVKFYVYDLARSSQTNNYPGKFNGSPVNFTSTRASIHTLFYTETYEGFKKLLHATYAWNESDETRAAAGMNPKNVSSLAISFDNLTGRVMGQIDFGLYGVTDLGTLGKGDDTNYPQSEVVVTEVEGREQPNCIFGPTLTPVPSLLEWLEQNGIELTPEILQQLQPDLNEQTQ
jgi:hypothetical protein